MYVLVVRDPSGNETEYDLVGEVILGRDDSAGVQLPDPNVSRRHARLFLEDGLCYIEDLGSSNGTLLDGQPVVGAVVLEAGREATLGPFAIFVEEPEGAEAPPPVDVRGADEATYAGPLPAAPDDDEHTNTHTGPGLHDQGPLGTLEGLSGAAIGQYFELGDRATVGRVAGNDLVIDDPSVSRSHALIVLDGGLLLVRDLGSSNGSFVNEAPADDLELQDGDIVRFGNVEFRFAAGAGLGGEALMPVDPSLDVGPLPSLGRAGAGRGGRPVRGARGGAGGLDKRKKLLLGGVGALVILFGIGFALRGKGPPPAPANDTPASSDDKATEDLTAKTYEFLRRARAYMDAERWKDAQTALQKVIDADPINTEARKLLRQVELEEKMQQVYSDAERKSELGDDDPAFKLYLKIDKRSSYYRRAKFKVRNLMDILSKRDVSDCKGDARAGRWKDALKACGQYMDFACQCPGNTDPRMPKLLHVAEERMHVPASKRWHCPPELAPWSACADVVVHEVDPGAVLGGIYDDKRLRTAIKQYYNGDVEKSLKRLNKLRKDFKLGAVQSTADDLYAQMKIAQGKFTEGQAYMYKNDVKSARSAWELVLAADRKIIPDQRLRSFYRKSVLSSLVGAYTDQGKQRIASERYQDAFGLFQKAAKVDKDDPRVKAGFQRLEDQGAYLLDNASSCSDVAKVLAITVADPPSPTHRQAQAQAKQRGCQ